MSPLDTFNRILQLDHLPEELRLHLEQQVSFFKRVIADETAFQHLGGRLDCGLLVVDERGVITYLNDRLGEIFRAPQSQMVGQFITGWVEEADRATFFQQFSMRHHRGSSTPYRLRCRRADKSGVCVSISPYPRFDEKGEFRGTFAMVFEAPGDGPRDGEADLGRSLEGSQAPAMESLSTREQEIVHMLLGGQDVTQVAEACEISRHTVRNHIKVIYLKLGVHSRAELARRVLGS